MFKIKHYKSIKSTNKKASEFCRKGIYNIVVVADEQREGVGRYGRSWYSPKGGLYFSILLKPKIEISSISSLPLVCGVGVANGLKKFGFPVKLKWPNDLILNGKKVGGILCKLEIQKECFVIMGVGINVNIEKFPSTLPSATSLFIDSGKKINTSTLLNELLDNIKRTYDKFERNKDKILNDWRKFSDTLGRKVKILSSSGEFSGKAVDIDENGYLLVRDDDGYIEKVIEGDCIYY
ncbi:MAG: biotin--[acetyl-CoA-carboxylase] ligase [Candidatus Thermoplasmatota archaeon]